ncbi:MAG: TlpA disulfide reductase family protein [bacterium]
MRRFIILMAILLPALFSFAQKDDDRGYIVRVGDEAPNIQLQLTDGSSFTLDELKGKVVVLQFTASWCSVCRKEMPHLEKEVWLPNKDRDFILIGVDYDEPLEKVISFKEKMKITYPMALDPGAEIFALFAHKKSGVTRNVVIDRTGHIAFLTRLFDREEFDGMKTKIQELLKP